MTQNAMASYLNLAGNEIVNAARLKAYVDNGIKPMGMDVRCGGCDGLSDIIPCIDLPVDPLDPVAINGYQLPEIDTAPWYDVNAPESADFAGLMVTSVDISSPYSRTATPNIGQGQVLGRLKKNGRSIVVTGWLIGRTCCAVQYGLHWLNSVLEDNSCASGDCGGGTLGFLDCCPQLTEQTECLTTTDIITGKTEVYIRQPGDTEFERGSDFFRNMNGVGVSDGVNVLSCRGSNCGCGSCGQIIEVQFTLLTSDAYFNSVGTDIIMDEHPACDDTDPCYVTWKKVADGESCPDPCATVSVDLDDPNCPLPTLPPSKGLILPVTCGTCLAVHSSRVCSSPQNLGQGKPDWSSSTVNFTVTAGTVPLRNLEIRGWENPLNQDCSNPKFFPDCDSCFAFGVSYVPAGATLEFSGETRTITVTKGIVTQNAFSSVTSADGGSFGWPDFSCVDICACVTFDCSNSSPDASVTITRIDRVT